MAAAALLALGACGSDQSRGGKVQGTTLTVFRSLPLQGPDRERASSIVNAEKLALRDAGGKAGDFTINFASSDDSTAGKGSKAAGWDPDKTAENARSAVGHPHDRLCGGLRLGRDGHLPADHRRGRVRAGQPGATAVGLTKLVPGAEAGEPDKYYPSGGRSSPVWFRR